MSVNEGDRNIPDTPQNRGLYACDFARKLAIHTIKICKNKNIFLEEYDDSVTSKIVGISIDIFTHAWGANTIKVDKSPERWRNRKNLQELSINECNRLIGMIQIAKPLFHLKSKKVKYWIELASKARNYLQKWKEADVNRYGNLGM